MRAAVAIGLGLSLIFVPVTGAASPPVQPLPATANSNPEVEALHESGLAAFEVDDHDTALIVWKRAFVLTPFDQQATRAALVANIVAAHRLAYERSRNPEHLAEGIRVIDFRKVELAQLHRRDEAAIREKDDLGAQRSELVGLQRLARRSDEVPSELAPGVAFEFEREPAVPSDHPDAPMIADPELGPSFRRAKAMADAGIVVLAIGGGVAATTILLGAAYQPKDGTPLAVLPLALPLGGVAVALLATGGTLLGVGKKRKAALRETYWGRDGRVATLAPLMLPAGGGLGLFGRF